MLTTEEIGKAHSRIVRNIERLRISQERYEKTMLIIALSATRWQSTNATATSERELRFGHLRQSVYNRCE